MLGVNTDVDVGIMQHDNNFFESSLKKTYAYFTKHGLHKHYKSDKIDPFDSFIMDKISFFVFVISEFYKNQKPNSLRLSQMADEKLLNHLDEAIVDYIESNEDKKLMNVKEVHIYILETSILKLVLKRENA